MFKLNKKRKGFTLVEMLIVIVIIGILASALIPRLSKARERANDTARKSHLQSVAAALVSYQIDKGRYPTTPGMLNEIDGDGSSLIVAGLSDIPVDPDTGRSFNGVGADAANCAITTGGQYAYTAIKKDGVAGGGFVLMAGTQTEGGSNWVYEDIGAAANGLNAEGCIYNQTDYRQINNCEFQLVRGVTDTDACIYALEDDALRYIYRQ